MKYNVWLCVSYASVSYPLQPSLKHLAMGISSTKKYHKSITSHLVLQVSLTSRYVSSTHTYTHTYNYHTIFKYLHLLELTLDYKQIINKLYTLIHNPLRKSKTATSHLPIEEDSNQSCIIPIEEDTTIESIMCLKIINVVLTIICVGLLAFSNGTMENGTNIESTEGGLMKIIWKAKKPIISPDTAASKISVANATKLRINHNNNNHNNITNITNNNNITNNYYNNYNYCNHKP
ncbi:hypothetical protein QTP88_018216 [Uroleucon formosanum]